MSSRARILEAIRNEKPGQRDLPTLPPDPPAPDAATLAEWEANFREVLAASKTTFVEPGRLSALRSRTSERTPSLSTIAGISPVTCRLPAKRLPTRYSSLRVDLTILIRARIGVAENGAMWVIRRPRAIHRVLPFITQHLVIVVDRSKLVATMHQAYRQTEIAATGFGVFIAGPSKTADIEQSLVIGAHGPRSLVVCLSDSPSASAPER